MWISKQEYDDLIRKAEKYDEIMNAMRWVGSIKFDGYTVVSDIKMDELMRVAEDTALEEEIKDLKEERDTWINLYRQKDADAEFWKSLYVDFRKLYEESCTVKK